MTQNQILYRQHQETVKHNREMERLTGEAQAETARANRAKEYETSYHNRVTENLSREVNVINDTHYKRQDSAALTSALASASQAQTQAAKAPSEIAKNQAAAKQSVASAINTLFMAPVNHAYASAQAANQKAQAQKTSVQTLTAKQEAMWYTPNQVVSNVSTAVNAASNFLRGISSVVDTTRKVVETATGVGNANKDGVSLYSIAGKMLKKGAK